MVLESAVPPGGAERHFSADPVEKGEMLQFGGLSKEEDGSLVPLSPAAFHTKGCLSSQETPTAHYSFLASDFEYEVGCFPAHHL